MTFYRRLLSVALFALALGAVADEPRTGLAGPERRARVVAQFDTVVASPVYREFAALEAAGKVDAAALESYLEWLPVPPAELDALYRELRYDMGPVPQAVDERQTSWVKLHEAEARELYGDRYVDFRLGIAKGGGARALPFAVQFTDNNNAIGTYQRYEPDKYQGEVSVAVNPGNPDQVIVASNSWGNIPGLCASEDTLAIGASQDGGQSWTYTCAPPSAGYFLGTCPAGGSVLGGDPVAAWNGFGYAFVNYVVFCHVSSNDVRGAIVTIRSLDGGATWQIHSLISNGWSSLDYNDKPMFTIDTNPASPYYNRQYSCWHRGAKAVTAYSANGQFWAVQEFPIGINISSYYACDVAVGPNGSVHLVFNSDDTNHPARINYFRSDNGGVSWTPIKFVAGLKLVPYQKPAAQDQRGIFPFAAIDVDTTGGPCAGRIYVAYSDYAAGETVNSTDVFLRSSADGVLWSNPVKINDDGLAGRVQFHPAMRVDPASGDVFVAWYDARNSATNRAVEIYAARSLDCGASFEPNVRVTSYSTDFRNFVTRASNENSTDNPLFNQNQFGEYMGLDAAGGRAYVSWVDTREFWPSWTDRPEKENLGFSRIDFGASCGNGLREGLEVCDGADLAGKSCTSQGFPAGGALTCYADCRGFYTGNCFGERFYSIETHDGSVEAGYLGFLSATSTYDGYGVRLGDTAFDGLRRGFLSFDTAAIPDGATITSATLHLYRASLVGLNPMAGGFGAVSIAMSHAFNGNVALEAADFSAASLGTAGCTLSNPPGDHGEALCTLSAAGLNLINKTGHTQFRISMAASNGNDQGDYLVFFDGASLGAIYRPMLVVKW
ncbi:MAG: hypothetical protein SF066_16360 [Thermoanaerobaculia bacterium]|nr:hypothetical protein [Thermoanaerobaculia bacterium]